MNRVYHSIKKITYNPLIIQNNIRRSQSVIASQKHKNIIIRKLSYSSSPPPPPPPYYNSLLIFMAVITGININVILGGLDEYYTK